MNPVMRRAKVTDADAIARVHIDTWRSTYQGIMPDEHLAQLSYENRATGWRDILSDVTSPSFTFLAESETGVVGFATGGPERAGNATYKGELFGIYVLEARQRQGIGQRLTLAVAEELQRRGHNSMLVWVLKDNPSRAFYERFGGAPVGEKQILIGGRSLIEVAYGWRDLDVLLGRSTDSGKGV
jgi:ribosomal protein S18 acetylase RimI-like enzyme